MNLPKGKKLLRIASASVLASSSILSLGFASLAHASNLSNVEVRFDNMKVSAGTTGTICAKPATAGTEAFVAITFPTGFTVGAAGTWAVNTTNLAWPTGAIAWPGITTTPAPTVSSQTVTFTAGDLTVGTLYCFNWTGTTSVTEPVTNGNSELGSVTTQLAGNTPLDSSPYATATLTDNTVVVTATVPPLFQMSMNVNSDALGTINTLNPVSSSGTKPAVTINTNAKNGWQLWGNDNNTGLKSTQANYTIASHTGTLATGQEFYNTGVFSKTQVGGAGTISIVAGWDDTTPNFTGTGLTTSLQTIATSNGTTDTGVVTLINNAVIKATTPAATDYSDTQNYVAAALF